MSRKLSNAIAETALDGSEAAVNSAITIAARLPIMLRPGAEGCAEWHSASSEKMVAMWEGTLAVWAAWNDVMWRTLVAPLTPAGMAHEALALVRAGSKPGHARVRANAARFRDL